MSINDYYWSSFVTRKKSSMLTAVIRYRDLGSDRPTRVSPEVN